MDVTAAAITDNVYQTGLDYFGNVLADIKARFPLLTKVDVIAHSTGGVIARSYIQSTAYGQSGLPTIDDLVLEARDGRFRIEQTNLERFNDRGGGWGGIGKWWGSGWKKAEQAYQASATVVAQCVMTGPTKDNW